jgi:hypothetical protein
VKLAKIVHERCNEYSASTFVWVPDSQDPDEFDAIVLRAQTKYLKFLEDFKAANPLENPGFSPDYKNNPDKTVKEIEAEHKIKRDAYLAYEKDRAKSKAKFSTFLQEEGFKAFWEVEPEIVTYVSWGHFHGASFDYKEDFPKDFPVTEKDKEEEWV